MLGVKSQISALPGLKLKYSDEVKAAQKAAISWLAVVDPGTGKTYYWNTVTRETQWTKPKTPGKTSSPKLSKSPSLLAKALSQSDSKFAEARKRILTLTAAMEAERAEREAEAAARRERPLKPGKRGVMWNAVEDKEFEVTTSTGRKDAIHVKVWGGGARRRPRESSSGGPLSLSLSLSLGDEA